MTGQITEQQAMETLLEGDYRDIGVSQTEHELPNIVLEATNYEEGGFFADREESAEYEKWQVDEAVKDMYGLMTFWAEEKGYEVSVDRKDIFKEPIHQELLMNIEGSISIEGKEIGFQYRGGFPRINSDNPSPSLEFSYGRFTGGNREDKYDHFDASMTDDFRELYSLSESVLEQFGEITDREPEL